MVPVSLGGLAVWTAHAMAQPTDVSPIVGDTTTPGRRRRRSSPSTPPSLSPCRSGDPCTSRATPTRGAPPAPLPPRAMRLGGFNRNGVPDSLDFAAVLNRFGQSGARPRPTGRFR